MEDVFQKPAQSQFICETTALSAISTRVANVRAIKRVNEIYEGDGIGTMLPAAKGTAWGLLNAVTQYVDHERRTCNAEHRVHSAWFGQGAAIQQRALSVALKSIA